VSNAAMFLDVDGWQYVIDNEGEHVHGVWIHVDKPMIVKALNGDENVE
jgi:hypothetical protein